MFAAAITIAGSKGILHGAKIKGLVIKIRKNKTLFYVSFLSALGREGIFVFIWLNLFCL